MRSPPQIAKTKYDAEGEFKYLATLASDNVLTS